MSIRQTASFQGKADEILSALREFFHCRADCWEMPTGGEESIEPPAAVVNLFYSGPQTPGGSSNTHVAVVRVDDENCHVSLLVQGTSRPTGKDIESMRTFAEQLFAALGEKFPQHSISPLQTMGAAGNSGCLGMLLLAVGLLAILLG